MPEAAEQQRERQRDAETPYRRERGGDIDTVQSAEEQHEAERERGRGGLPNVSCRRSYAFVDGHCGLRAGRITEQRLGAVQILDGVDVEPARVADVNGSHQAARRQDSDAAARSERLLESRRDTRAVERFTAGNLLSSEREDATVKAGRISWAIMLAMAACCTSDLLHGESADPQRYPSFAAGWVSREHRYRVDVRVRPFLFWMRKANIGDGRLTWRAGPNGTVGYELLVGSDPGRTPRRINRWGYLREESGAGGAMVLGVMSHSDEQSVEEADKNTNGSDGVHAFKALRQVVTGSQARITVSDVRVSRDLTYADLETLLASIPAAPSKTKSVDVAEWSSPGFLAAVASLMEEGRTAAGEVSASPRFVRVYPYNGKLYELRLRSAERVDRRTSAGKSFGPAIRARFRVLNRATGDETPFTVVYGADGDLAGVPLLISWRPRWWLEIECVLCDDAGA